MTKITNDMFKTREVIRPEFVFNEVFIIVSSNRYLKKIFIQFFAFRSPLLRLTPFG